MYTYKECYKILQINQGISWIDFRKAYKKQIQKWHPDRFTDKVKKASAEDKIKELNIAFEQLSQYYKKNAAFPDLAPPAPKSSIPVKTDRDNTTSESGSNQSVTIDPIPENRKDRYEKSIKHKAPARIISLFMLAGVMVYILLNNDADEPKPTQDDAKNSHLSTETPAKKELIKKNNQGQPSPPVEVTPDAQEKPMPRYFTYGSTIGEVLSIQGKPDYIEDNVWFYGKSFIEFEDGVVKNWKRTPDNPLNANIDI